MVTFAIYSNNNGNMVVGEIPELFLFPKRDISTARCKCTIYIFTYKSIKVVIRTEFINMTVFLSTWPFFFVLFSFWTNLWPVLAKNAGKAFIHRIKIYCLVTTLYEVFNRLQAFPFFLLWGIKVGIDRRHILHSWVADQSSLREMS